MSLLRVADVWPGSPQAAVFEVLGTAEAEAAKAASAEAKALGYRVKTRGLTVEVRDGVWHVELRVREVPA